MWGGYKVTSTTELGYRWLDGSGNQNKYRSDLNYSQGFRLFDSNLLLESPSGKGKYFDSLLISQSGWGEDPSGFTRFRMEKTGDYRVSGNVRRVKYFNNLVNHVLGEHTSDTTHNFGDFDFILFPQSERLRVNFGISYNDTRGPGLWTTRAYGDEFAVNSSADSRSIDYRFGVEGRLGGFNLGVTQGFRVFKDDTSFDLTGPNLGNNPTNTARLTTFSRFMPVEGNTAYTQFNAQRTFARKLDFTARVIYSNSTSDMQLTENQSGRDQNNNIIILDTFSGSGEAKRTQFRGDIGMTYMVTNKFRISDTFSFDRFSLTGDEDFFNTIYRTTATGGTTNPPTPYTASLGYRLNNYRRFVNTIEGDYQFSRRVAAHIGYRYTKRDVEVAGVDRTLTSATSATNPLIIAEDESNHTNALIAGMKVMPTKNWVVFWDVEHGTADNVFTRLENYKYTNFRVRTRVTVDKVVFSFSAITKDNENPSTTLTNPNLSFVTDVRSRFYSGSVEWNPMRDLTVGGGYTFRDQHSYTPILVPIASVQTPGFSEFFSKDHFGYLDVSARPFDRMTLFASYRINWDKGQGDLVSLLPQNIITSYPMQFTSPEFRVAFRLTRNIDWNVGYQYFNYHDSQFPIQNYNAHLPFTSLRIYFGGRAMDR
jgi:hypothetical protein